MKHTVPLAIELDGVEVSGSEERALVLKEYWRWHFAGQLMAGLLSNPRETEIGSSTSQSFAETSVQAADLLVERLLEETP